MRHGDYVFAGWEIHCDGRRGVHQPLGRGFRKTDTASTHVTTLAFAIFIDGTILNSVSLSGDAVFNYYRFDLAKKALVTKIAVEALKDEGVASERNV